MHPEKNESGRFAPLEHLREYELLVSQELNQLAQGHADASDGRFTLLPVDSDLHPSQKVTVQSIKGAPTTVPKLIEIGEAVNEGHSERFHSMIQTFLEAERSQELVTTLGEDLSSGQNIIVITNHSQIQDIAEALGACHIALQLVGEDNNRDYAFSTNIMLSKMITHLGYRGIPVPDLLKAVCDRQYYSFPKTDSIRGTTIPEFLVKAYNAQLKLRIGRKLNKGGNLFGIAPSGTVDKPPTEGSPDKIILGSVGNGTVDILTSANTKVLAVAVYKSESDFVFEILGTPKHMRDADDVHTAMEDIASVLNKSVDGKTFQYPRPLS